VSTLGIVVLVVLAVLALLFLGGVIGSGRRRQALAGRLEAELQAADAALAQARAGDRGWDRALIDAAAREALAAERPGAEVRELQLVQVVDRPGTDADEAVIRALLADGSQATVRLGRRDGAWTSAQAR
jgi:type II secretory pathway pseudopilin PulG